MFDKSIEQFAQAICPQYPWHLVEVLSGVDAGKTYQDGFAEIGVDAKVQGKYLNICLVLNKTGGVPDGTPTHADPGDLVCVWASAIEKFSLLDLGQVTLIRDADIFIRILPGTTLYNQLLDQIENGIPATT